MSTSRRGQGRFSPVGVEVGEQGGESMEPCGPADVAPKEYPGSTCILPADNGSGHVRCGSESGGPISAATKNAPQAIAWGSSR